MRDGSWPDWHHHVWQFSFVKGFRAPLTRKAARPGTVHGREAALRVTAGKAGRMPIEGDLWLIHIPRGNFVFNEFAADSL